MIRLIIASFVLVCIVSANETPLPDYNILGQAYDQHNKNSKVIDPHHERTRLEFDIGNGYSFVKNTVARLEWSYSKDKFQYDDIEKSINNKFKMVLVREDIVDGGKIKTWYVAELSIWITLRDIVDKRFPQYQVEYAGNLWARLNSVNLKNYPLPK